MPPPLAAWVSVAIVVLWALWAAAFNTAQFGDNIEQFNWAQSLELGYQKHPPLPSWLLGAVIKLFGPSVYWAYALATLCLIGTIGFTWLIGRELLGERLAAAGVVLWGLNMTFSERVQLYNHNTVLVLCIATTVWLMMRAVRPGRSLPVSLAWWAAAGAAAGAAMLSKYQAAVPLAALLWVLAMAGHLKRPANLGGLLLACAVMLGVFTPHAIWVVQHDFSTVRYASDAIESAGLRQRIGFIVSFMANQVRIWFPALLAVGVYALLARFTAARAQLTAAAAAAPDLGLWMFALVWSGLLVLAVMALAFGVSLRNHWGVQVLQFFCLWLAWRWEQRATIDLRRLVWAAVIVHAASLAWYATEHADPARVLSNRRIDTMYPARRLARTAVAHWTATTTCPLRYVAGTVFDAGLVSLYSGGRLEVFDSEKATPWIHPDDLQRSGVLYVLDDIDDAVPQGVTHVIEFDLVRGNRHGRPPKTIRLGVQLPQQPCS
jgi:4-amino-4-deoxy-L-arabinose transferase-like glycosyltransferase